MGEFKKPTSEDEFEHNFGQIKPLMNATEAYIESSRCLFCFDAPCHQACPTGIDIPLFIRQINSGDFTGSAMTIYTANYFGNACGKVCPTEVLCEGACVYTEQNVKPVEIGRLQNYVTGYAIDQSKRLFEVGEATGKKVAIIGSGPAGISCACELRVLGYEVDIYESKDKPSGLTLHGVAPYKITNEEVLKEMAYLQQMFDYNIIYNTPISSKDELRRLEADYEAIFIGIGLGSTSSLKMKGENLKNCFGATELIEELRLKHHQVEIGKKVVVLGAGNTAMDAASESARMGADKVILAYRGSQESMRAYEFEYDLAKIVGVDGIFNVAPLAIVGDENVEGVEFIRTKDQDGQLVVIEGSEFIEECDMVIRATGQSKQVNFLNKIEGLQLDGKKRISVNHETFQTRNPKYFAAGDAVNGGKEVVNAAADGKQAAQGIHNYLSK
jgi:dihydropyrimidine dehydrogenase (NAD+) subunit PreT